MTLVRVEITLCEWKSHYACKNYSQPCENHTQASENTLRAGVTLCVLESHSCVSNFFNLLLCWLWFFIHFHLRWSDSMWVNTFSTDKNKSQLRPKTQIFIKRVEMTAKSLKTPWMSEMLSNRAGSFFFSSAITLHPPWKSKLIFLVRHSNGWSCNKIFYLTVNQPNWCHFRSDLRK
jgi:hypothetical protein